MAESSQYESRYILMLPGIASALIAMSAPTAAHTALRLFSDSRVKEFTEDLVSLGVVDLHLQIITLYTTSLVLALSSVVYLVKGKSKELKAVSTATLVGTLAIFVWIFAMGGVASISLDHYIPKEGGYHPGEISLPPPGSWLTWARGVLFAVSLVFTFYSSRDHGQESV